MSDHTPSMAEIWECVCGEGAIGFEPAEFDRFTAKVKADALREAAEATRREAPGEPHAGASFSSHAHWLDDRADQIERGTHEWSA